MGGVADLITLDDITAAADAIAGHVLRTPTVASPGLAALLGVPVSLKLELLQRTGSFKPRGAFRKLLGLSSAERAAGVVAVSGGNHALAVADAAGSLGVGATVVMPSSVPGWVVARCRDAGAEVRLTEDVTAAFALLDELVAGGMTLLHARVQAGAAELGARVAWAPTGAAALALVRHGFAPDTYCTDL